MSESELNTWIGTYNTRCADELRLPKCLRYQKCLKSISKKRRKQQQQQQQQQQKTLNGDKLNISVNIVSRKEHTK